MNKTVYIVMLYHVIYIYIYIFHILYHVKYYTIFYMLSYTCYIYNYHITLTYMKIGISTTDSNIFVDSSFIEKIVCVKITIPSSRK